MQNLYYVQDSRQYVGNDMLWWAEGGGYTTNLNKAALYHKDEALEIRANRGTDIIWPRQYINSISITVVDAQHRDLDYKVTK